MIGMVLTRKQHGDLQQLADHVTVKMAARITNLWAETFAEYVRRTQLSGQVLAVRTGETRASVGFFKLKGTKASFAVRPGKDVPGRLNYLAGMQRGMLAGPGRKVIIRPKPFMKPGLETWRSSGAARDIKNAVLAAYIDRWQREFTESLEIIGGIT